jgi:transcriptional regulator with XRE-family HTH domain
MTRQQIGRNFWRLRQLRGWTLAEAAERLGYSGSGAIHNIESGRRLPAIEKLPEIAAAFDLTLGELVAELYRSKRP